MLFMEHQKQLWDMQYWERFDRIEPYEICSVGELAKISNQAILLDGDSFHELGKLPSALSNSSVEFLFFCLCPVNAQLIEAAVCKVSHMTFECMDFGLTEMEILSAALNLSNAKLKSLEFIDCNLNPVEWSQIVNHIEHLSIQFVNIKKDLSLLGIALQSPQCRVWDLKYLPELGGDTPDWVANLLQNQESRLRKLELLTVSSNLVEALKSPKCKLEGLELRSEFDDEDLVSILEAIVNMSNLWYLRCFDCFFFCDGETTIQSMLSSTKCKLQSLSMEFRCGKSILRDIDSLQDDILKAIEGNPNSFIQHLDIGSWRSDALETRYKALVARNAHNISSIMQGESHKDIEDTREKSGRKGGLGKSKDPFSKPREYPHNLAISTQPAEIVQVNERGEVVMNEAGKKYEYTMLCALRKTCKDPIDDLKSEQNRQALIDEMEAKYGTQVSRKWMKKRFGQMNKNRRDKLFRQIRKGMPPSKEEEYPDYVIERFKRIIMREESQGIKYVNQSKAGKSVKNRHKTGRAGKRVHFHDACMENEEKRPVKQAKKVSSVDLSTLNLDLSIWSQNIKEFPSIENVLPLEFKFKDMSEIIGKESWSKVEMPGSKLDTAIVHLYTMFLFCSIPYDKQAHWLFYDPINMVNLDVKIPKTRNMNGIKYAVFPLCYENHWCLYVALLERNEMWCFDSLNNEPCQKISMVMTEAVDKLLVNGGKEPLKLTPRIIPSPKQEDGYSCGLHVMVCMRLLVLLLVRGEQSTEQFGTEAWYSKDAPEKERQKLLELVKAVVHGAPLGGKVEGFIMKTVNSQVSSGNAQVEEWKFVNNVCQVDVNTESEKTPELMPEVNEILKIVQPQQQVQVPSLEEAEDRADSCPVCYGNEDSFVNAQVEANIIKEEDGLDENTTAAVLPKQTVVHTHVPLCEIPRVTAGEHYIDKLKRLFPDANMSGSMIAAAFKLNPDEKKALFGSEDAVILSTMKHWRKNNFRYH